jgi:U3 small nucleolar RNA-associated protein 7
MVFNEVHMHAQGPVRALAFDSLGRYMATAGADGQVTIFDVRNTYQPVNSYYSHAPADCLDISQRGLLAVAHGRSVQVREG